VRLDWIGEIYVAVRAGQVRRMRTAGDGRKKSAGARRR
jgi:hypothetical protein